MVRPATAQHPSSDDLQADQRPRIVQNSRPAAPMFSGWGPHF